MIKHKLKTRSISVLFASVFVLILAMFVALIPIRSKNIAFADSSSGVVGNNIFSNPDFSLTGNDIGSVGLSSGQLNIRYWDGTVSYNSSSISLTMSSFDSYFILLFKPSSASTYNFTVNYSFTGSSISYCRLRSSSWTTLVSGSITSNYISFNYTFSSSQLNDYYFIQIGGGSIGDVLTLNWVKVELGSSFTGYVPKNYSNYGYDQGLNTVYSYNLSTISQSDISNSNFSSFKIFGDSSINPATGGIISNIPGQNINISYSGFSSSQSFYLYIPFSHSIVKGGNVNISGISHNGLSSDYYCSFLQFDSDGYDNTVQIGFVDYPYTISNIGNFVDTVTFNSYDLVDGYLFANSNIMNIPSGVNSSYTLYNDKSVSYGLLIRIERYQTLYICGGLSFDTSNISIIDNDTDLLQSEYNKGYSNGYNKGVLDTRDHNNDYTFFGLMSSVIDAPVSVLGNSLEFEFLGFNLRQVVFSFLTVALIIFIIRIFI